MRMEKYPFFPLFVDLSAKKLLVVGGGKIARRRIRVLSDFTPRLTVIAPELDPMLVPLEREGRLIVLRRRYAPGDSEGAALVFAATNDSAVNAAVAAECRHLGIPVNVSSDRGLSDFYFPGIARRDNVVIGVTASGENHAQAKQVTDQVRLWMEASLPHGIAEGE